MITEHVQQPRNINLCKMPPNMLFYRSTMGLGLSKPEILRKNWRVLFTIEAHKSGICSCTNEFLHNSVALKCIYEMEKSQWRVTLRWTVLTTIRGIAERGGKKRTEHKLCYHHSCGDQWDCLNKRPLSKPTITKVTTNTNIQTLLK